jgi:hypothetical protein
MIENLLVYEKKKVIKAKICTFSIAILPSFARDRDALSIVASK